MTSTTSPTSPARATSMSPFPATPGEASSTPASDPAMSGPTYAVAHLRVTATITGNIYLAPPPAATPARISAATAFRTARHQWGNPEGTTTPRVVLTSYTNNGQGTIRADNTIKRFYVHRLTWAVIDYGGICLVSGNAPTPPGSPPPTPAYSHDCLTTSFVDALTGRDLGSMDEGGPGTHNVSTE